MREGALPSPVNQARVIQEVVALAKREGFRVNLIEAYDQPWKRQLEGTVGGHWGLYDAYRRQAKFAWGGAVSNHPHWRWQAAGGVALAAVIFAGALAMRWRTAAKAGTGLWLRVAAIAIVSGTPIGWTVENVPLESLTAGDWLRSLAWAAVALLSPIAVASAMAAGKRTPSFARILGRRTERVGDGLELMLGSLLIVLAVLAAQAALGLVFDARYRDFPFAPITGAVVPFLLLASSTPWKLRPDAPAAETAMAITLALSAVYIAFNESFANWQALWFGAGLIALTCTLLQARDAPG
jgi:hypothetical protein